MTQFGSQIQTAVHVRLATAAALDTCTYSDTTALVPANQDLGAKLVATVAGALTVDSVAAAVDDDILVKDQSSTLQNGVYRVRSAGSTTTVWSLERSRQARDSGQFDGMIVTTGPDGTANASTTYLYGGVVAPVIGTDAILYVHNTAPAGTATTQPAGTSNTTVATTEFVILNESNTLTVFSTISPGDTISPVANGYTRNILAFDPGGTIATLTIVMPDGAFDGQDYQLSFSSIVTALTLNGTFTSSGDGLAKPTVTTATSNFGFTWDVVTATPAWRRYR
jgi:hypothetical protein